jgi:hypothetical protein
MCLGESFAHPLLVLSLQDAAELDETIGGIVEHGEDRSPVEDRQWHQEPLLLERGGDGVGHVFVAGRVEQPGELEHGFGVDRDSRKLHETEATGTRA